MADQRARSLQEILREKATAGPRIDWEKARDEYLAAVERLYADVRGWLGPSVDERVAAITSDSLELAETYIGPYVAPALSVTVGGVRVRFEPKGRNIVGSKGRVDITCGRNEQMVLLDAAGRWMFGAREPRLRTWPVTEESFTEMMERILS